MIGRPSSENRLRIWDPLVRVGHWLLVAAFFTAYLTEDELLTVHVWAGYLAGAIVLGRVVWGFVGTRHARFRDFLYPPATALGYFGCLLRGKGQRYLGHSPAGGIMVVLLLLGVAAATWSGLMVYAYDQQAGPLATFVSSPRTFAGAANEDEQRQAEGIEGGTFAAREAYWEETHELFVNLTLLLVILHVGGVLLASFVHRENLVAAMVTGKKRPLDMDT